MIALVDRPCIKVPIRITSMIAFEFDAPPPPGRPALVAVLDVDLGIVKLRGCQLMSEGGVHSVRPPKASLLKFGRAVEISRTMSLRIGAKAAEELAAGHWPHRKLSAAPVDRGVG